MLTGLSVDRFFLTSVRPEIYLCCPFLSGLQSHRIEHVVNFAFWGEIGDSTFTEKQHLGFHDAMRVAVLGEHRFKAIGPRGGGADVVD